MSMVRGRFSTDNDFFPFGFHVLGSAWDEYQMDNLLQDAEGAPFLFAMRRLADRVNANRPAPTYAVPVIHAGEMLAMGIITEAARHVINRYNTEFAPGALDAGVRDALAALGAPAAKVFPAFVEHYPLRRFAAGVFEPVARDSRGVTQASLGREMILLQLNMSNPAMDPFVDIFDDERLRRSAPYELLVEQLETHFENQPPVRGSNLSLFEFLRAPIKNSPNSLQGQLEYIAAFWRELLPAELLEQIVLAADVMREEMRMRGHGPGPIQVLQFPEYLLDLDYGEPERFSPDRDWMANVVLIAKSVYVWLDQLSRKYQRPIYHLNHVPDEELDCLARWGFTGLWLIGVWERSPASQKIKRIMGNPEAMASAYSVYDYVVAGDLGGEAAYADLHDRAWRRGIRLASDMVPNHVGLFSKWVIEHPQWFIQLNYPPFPGYQFTGPNLSDDDRVGLYIEDGYWSHRDAAVVFKRVDNWSGEVRYIYHGNDGTNMPWNDTAQLNFLMAEVREAVIQTILHVARKFPILRFDAAMTLAKKHYQRLWFPQPGDAGAVPSRAEFGMSRPDFERVFPEEFWREVVNRVQKEAPDTLLLAEAFWLMEGYFVRTLGMHRVYNSAFMNMLKMEDNGKYRLTIRNVLEFSPEVLKRFVNFMNNPDERTAVEQFGKGDKYVGVCVLMATMPGLPMFGHGQIEGYSEKYGMEYRRAYWDEQVDEQLVARHEAVIFPLLRRRHLFSGVAHFAFYDCVAFAGHVDENVFAYSNRAGNERALIIYNNAYSLATGSITTSVAWNAGNAEQKDLRRTRLYDALALNTQPNRYYIFRDYASGLEYVRRGSDIAERGFPVSLHAYQFNVFLDWREVVDEDGTWRMLCDSLGGNGVPSIMESYQEVVLAPIHAEYRKAVNADMLIALAAKQPGARKALGAAMADFLDAVAEHTRRQFDTEEVLDGIQAELDILERLEQEIRALDLPAPVEKYLLEPMPRGREKGLNAFWRIPLAYALIHPLITVKAAGDYSVQSTACSDDLLLSNVAQEAFEEATPGHEARQDALLLKVMACYPAAVDFFPTGAGALPLRQMLEDFQVQRSLGMNRYQGVLWLVKEPMERLLYWILLESIVALAAAGRLSREAVLARHRNVRQILAAMEQAGFNVDEMLRLLARQEAAAAVEETDAAAPDMPAEPAAPKAETDAPEE